MLFLPGPGVGQMNSPIVHCKNIDREHTQPTATLQTLSVTSGKNHTGSMHDFTHSGTCKSLSHCPLILSYGKLIKWECIESVPLKLLLHQRHSGWGVEGREKPCMEILHYLKVRSPVCWYAWAVT